MFLDLDPAAPVPLLLTSRRYAEEGMRRRLSAMR